MAVITGCTFRFAEYEVREPGLRVTRAGEPVAIEPKAHRVLVYLLQHPARIVAKEELLSAVWGDTAVSDNSLTRAIALLRRLLDDDPHMPQFIETISTVGYRFICSVEVTEDPQGGLANRDIASTESGATSEAVPTETQGRASRKLERSWLAAGVIALCLFSSAIWYLRRPLPSPRVTRYVQITHEGSLKIPIGTDGSRLYFDEWNSAQPVSQVAISGGEISRIPIALPQPFLQDVSPDGSTLLISSRDGDIYSLWTDKLPGNTLRHLVNASVNSAAWSPDGASVAYATAFGEILVIRSDGTGSQSVVPPASSTANRSTGSLAWSPDGTRLRFSRDQKVWEVSLDGSGLHMLLPNWRPSWWQQRGHWTADAETFVFLSREPRWGWAGMMSSQLWALDERQGWLRHPLSEPVQLTFGPIAYDHPILSKDGKTIFARGVIPRGELVRYDAESHQLRPYLGGISAEFLTFSPDGKYLAYVTFPESILWRANRDGSNPVRLTDPPLQPIVPRWSPDGSEILFNAPDESGRFLTYVISSDGGSPQLVLPLDQGQQLDPNWSPDGRKIVFSTQGFSGIGGLNAISSEVRILDLATHQVTTLPGSAHLAGPRWSPDGRYIAATSLDYLEVFDFNTQHWSKLGEKRDVNYPTFSRDGRFIYFLLLDPNPGVFRIPVSGGKAEQVVDLTGFRHTGAVTGWMGLDPTESPMLLREMGTDDIYALTLDAK